MIPPIISDSNIDFDKNDAQQVHDSQPSETKSDENPIPLPPRDRNKPLLTSKQRHTRKHPLIIPPSSLQTTLNKFTVPTPPINSDSVHSPSDHVYSNSCQEKAFDFDAQIESNMAILDDIPGDHDCVDSSVGNNRLGDEKDTDKVPAHHVSCEDLLEFADIKPSSRTRGKDSDQVRVMLKILGPTVGRGEGERRNFSNDDVLGDNRTMLANFRSHRLGFFQVDKNHQAAEGDVRCGPVGVQ